MMQHPFPSPLTLWTWEPGSRGYRDTLECHFYPLARGKWWGCGVDMFTGRNRAPTAEVEADHGLSGCYTTGPGLSLDGRKKLLYLIFPCPPSTA
jgi:hypothetical protein